MTVKKAKAKRQGKAKPLTVKKGKIFKDTLKVKLTTKEKADYASELAKDSIELRETEEKKKEVMSDFGAQAKKLESNISVLSRKVNTGEEWRGVEVQWICYFKTGKKKKVRLDTGEIIRVEDVTTEDRQGQLALNRQGKEE